MSEEIKNSVVMIIDNVPENLILLTNILQEEYNIKVFQNGKMAIESAFKNPPDLILLDTMMPEVDGYDICKELKEDIRFKEIPIIFINDSAGFFDKKKAFKAGGIDYISKPLDSSEVMARVKVHLTLRVLQNKLNSYNKKLKSIVDDQVKEITEGQLAIISAMTKLAEARDDDTGKHIERTQTFCKLLAEELKNDDEFKSIIDDNFIYNIYHASPLHDIGKISIPDRILLKPDKLTIDEFEVMKKHAAIGRDYLIEVYNKSPKNSFLKMGVEIAGGHHEKFDGTGYPKGLKGANIPLSARIMALADVYDALRSKRVYKNALSHETSVEIISEGKGKHFDPYIVDAFLKLEKDFNNIRECMGDMQ